MEENNIIMLEDENGNQVEFEVIDVYEFNGKTYFAMLEVMDEGEETDEVLIMRIEEGETEDDPQLVAVEDEAELEAAFDEFVRRDNEAYEAE